MIIHKHCVICEQPLRDTAKYDSTRLCMSVACQLAHRDHLRKRLLCCCACGRPIQISNCASGVGSTCSRAECQSQSNRMIGNQATFCRTCGIHLDNRAQNRDLGLCNSAVCQREDHSNTCIANAKAWSIARATRQKETAKIVQERLLALRPELRQEKSLNIVVLPYLEHGLEPPSMERKSRVANGLLRLATDAYAQIQEKVAPSEQESLPGPLVEDSSVLQEQNSFEERFARLNGAACGTCGGRCCNLGGDEAFLNSDKFLEFFLANPKKTPEDAVAFYMAKIPNATFQDSCIFHGHAGCGLTREQRSITCNTYLCSSLQDLQNSTYERNSTFVMAATNFRDRSESEPKVYRIVLVDEKSESIILTDKGEFEIAVT